MSFTILQKNTTITASDVNDNFIHVGQGDLLPRSGTSLTAIGSTYNLGSDQYRWSGVNVNNIFCDTANVSKFGGSYYYLDGYEINSINTATTRISFDISAYSNKYIEASIYLADCTTNAYLFLNGLSTVSFSESYLLYNTTYTAYYTTTTSPLVAYAGTTETANCCFSKITLNFGISFGYFIKFMSVCGSEDPYIQNYVYGNVLNNSTTTIITSLVFTGKFQTGASIKLWGIA